MELPPGRAAAVVQTAVAVLGNESLGHPIGAETIQLIRVEPLLRWGTFYLSGFFRLGGQLYDEGTT